MRAGGTSKEPFMLALPASLQGLQIDSAELRQLGQGLTPETTVIDLPWRDMQEIENFPGAPTGSLADDMSGMAWKADKSRVPSEIGSSLIARTASRPAYRPAVRVLRFTAISLPFAVMYLKMLHQSLRGPWPGDG
jgi:hypothetical protein